MMSMKQAIDERRIASFIVPTRDPVPAGREAPRIRISSTMIGGRPLFEFVSP